MLSIFLMFHAANSLAEDQFDSARSAAQDRLDEAHEKIRSQSQAEHWQIRRSRSPMDDSPAVRLDAISDSMHRDRYGREKPIILTIVCRENRTDTYISFAEHFMSDLNGGGKVQYRIDDKSAKSRDFVESNDHSVLGLWGGRKSIPWIRELLGADKLYVRATPYSESAVEGHVNIGGLESIISPLAEACNWTP
jgi:type VI secretion system protein VasI